HGKDFLLAGDVWFRGLNLRYGPDGGVYLSDWSDNGECHNVLETNRETGRMYKIVYGRPNSVPADLDLSKLSDADLVKLQLHKNDWYVRHARRILQERAAAGADMTDVNAALRKMFNEQSSVPRKLRVFWALHVTGGATPEFLLAQLQHESEYVRAWAIQFLVEDKQPSKSARHEFARLAESDPSPFVRLYLASALQRMPIEERWRIALGLVAHAEDASDHNLPLMIWYGMEPAVAANPKTALEFAACCEIPIISRFIARRIGLIDDPQHSQSEVAVLVKSIDETPSRGWQLDLLGGLHDALRGRRNVSPPENWAAAYRKLCASANREIKHEADAIALAFGDTDALVTLIAAAANKSLTVEERQRALAVLLEAHANCLIFPMQQMLDEPAMRLVALRGLAAYDDRSTPQAILKRYSQFSADEKREAIGALASRATYAGELLSAIERKQIPASDISMSAARQMQQLKNRDINRRLAADWGTLHNTPAEKVEQIQKFKNLLTAESQKPAEMPTGRATFAKTCGRCHSLFGEGGHIGPDLTGANRGNLDYLLQKVVDPSAAVPNDYQMQLISLKDGRVVSAIIRQRTPQAVVVQTETEQLTLATDDIESIKPSGQSLMPERQLDNLSREQIRDLFAYLMRKQ
ncbi:MAG TPA: dehydrogenase, partial [Pirellulales bacterium]|nr:dehydrogenase [Pirellulales bacterium]